MSETEAEILDDLHGLRDEVIDRTINLLYGTNDEDNSIHQIVGSALLDAYIKGRNDGNNR